MKAFARLIFETSPLTPFWSAIAAGFAMAGPDGRVYLTNAGQEYLDSLVSCGTFDSSKVTS
jgi:hypothetical protein